MPYEQKANTNNDNYWRRCWKTDCKKPALVEDNAGWQWCIRHYFWQRDSTNFFSKMRKIVWKNLLGQPPHIKR